VESLNETTTRFRTSSADDYNIGEYRRRGILPGFPDEIRAIVTDKNGRRVANLYKTEEGYSAEASDMSYRTEPYPSEREALEALRKGEEEEMTTRFRVRDKEEKLNKEKKQELFLRLQTKMYLCG